MKNKATAILLIFVLLVQAFIAQLAGAVQVYAQEPEASTFEALASLVDENGEPLTEEATLAAEDQVHVKIDWSLTGHTQQETYHIKLPEQWQPDKIEWKEEGHGDEMVTYSLNGTELTMSFPEQEEAVQASGTVELSAYFSQDAIGEAAETDLVFLIGDTAQVIPVSFQVKEELEQEPVQEEAPASTEEEQVNEEGDTPESKEQAPETEKEEETPVVDEEEVAAEEKQEDARKEEQEEASKENEENVEANDQEAEATEAAEADVVSQAVVGEIEKNIITGIVLRDGDGNLINADENPGNKPALGDDVQIEITWELPNGHGYGSGSTFTFSLPDIFHVYNDVNGELTFGDTTVGSFTLKEDGTVVMTFNEQIEELSNVHGLLNFRTIIREDLVGDVDREVVFDVKDEVVANIPISLQPKAGSAIDKRGQVNRAYNATEIEWTVDFNKQLKTINQAVLKDPIQQRQALKKDSIEVYKLDVQLDGTVKQGERVDPSEYTVTEDPFEIQFGDISSAYRVVFSTEITDEDGTNYANKATLTGKNSEDLSAEASVTTRRGEALAKRNASYDPATQTITWEIHYNYNEKSIKQADALLVDSFSESHDLIADSIKVERITLDENGNEKEASNADNYAVTPGQHGFELKFTEDINDAYKITYKTKANERVLEDGKIDNIVKSGGREANGSQGTSQQVLHKGYSNINYKDKTVQWRIDFNRDGYEMKDVFFTDTFTNGGLELERDSFKVLRKGTEVDPSEYTLEETDEGFTLRFHEPISEPHQIVYTTKFHYDELRGDQFRNHVHMKWTTEDGKTWEKEASSGFKPDTYTTNNGFKNGSYNAVTKEITWTVGINYDLKNLTVMNVTDYIKGKQTLVEGSIEVYRAELTGGSNGIRKGEKLEPSEYELELLSDEKPGFHVRFPGERDEAYIIEYKTSVEGELIVDRYDNTATLSSEGREPVDLNAHVTVQHGGSYVEKGGKQNGKVIDWNVAINAGQSKVSEAKVIDQQQANQILLEDSFRLYATTVSGNGQFAKAEELERDKDYTLEINTADDGSQTFVLSFLEDISRPYILEYQSYINASDGEEISNTIKFEGKQITTERTDSSETIKVRLTDGGGSGSGERGSLEVIKVDANSKEVLPGARFTLYDKEGKIALRTVVTGEDGKAIFRNLRYDDYLLKEDSAPDGYVVGIDAETVKVDSKTTTITVENKKITREVALTKVDVDTKQALAGAEFALEKKAGDNWETIEEGLVTNEDGQLVLTELEPGDYRFVETKAPVGYELDNQPIEFTIDDKQTERILLTKDNVIIKGSAVLKKVDAATGEPLEGVSFKLVQDGKTIKEGLVSDKDGFVKVSGLRPGSYELIETTALENYKLDPTPIPFEIEAGQEKELTIGEKENALVTGGIRLTKVDGDDNRLALQGAVFALLDEDGNVLREGLETDESGQLTIEQLAPGNYQLVETKAPVDYELDDTPIPFTIEKSQQETIQVERKVENHLITGAVELKKQDSKDGSVLEGAEFSLYTEDGELVEEGLVTGEDGTVYVEGLKPGKYYFVETQAPAHYQADDTKRPFTIERSQLEKVELIVENVLIPGAATLIKVDEDNENVRLEGAVYTLEDEDGTVIEEGLTTDEEGRIVVTDLPPGVYYFIETKAPEHYQLDNTPIKIEIEKGQQEAIQVKAVNKLVTGSVVLEKHDSESNALLLEGAEFSLVDENGNTVKEGLTTDASGRIVVEGLKPGKYAFVETKAPADYQLDEKPIPFEIVRSQKEALVVEKSNTLIPGAVELVKVNQHDTAETLAGAEFTLLDGEGNVLEEGLTTDEEGKLRVEQLAPGTYQFIETKAPQGFELSSEPLPFVIERSQQETLKVTAFNKLVRGEIELSKIDSDNDAIALKGAEFELRTKTGEVVASGTTNDAGKLVLSDILPGDYVLVETKAPFGYQLDATPIDVTVDRDQKTAVSVTKENTLIPGSVIVEKVDAADQQLLLTGAAFSLLDEAGNVLQENLMTDQHGRLEINNLPPGDYQLVETKAPEHYQLDETPIVFTIEKGQTAAPVITVENTLTPGSVEIVKVDSSDGARLEGAVFTVLTEDGDIVAEGLTTDGSGSVQLDGLAPGKYQLVETKAPADYQLNETPILFEISKGQTERLVLTVENTLIPPGEEPKEPQPPSEPKEPQPPSEPKQPPTEPGDGQTPTGPQNNNGGTGTGKTGQPKAGGGDPSPLLSKGAQPASGGQLPQTGETEMFMLMVAGLLLMAIGALTLVNGRLARKRG
ncbi:SpaA isopeptide-forming pilin-related protein [Shouchella clausii]|uniref:SpaA isopeptide-forming pilin-related protein n=1 Tax=Shouchella clausii TaxID=79880 RepID=UPI0021483370|nr:SpaA isopeptide-forming pilin-related protein [Shouchella clausii]MCR1288662.1 SpaA isopeptide-forming pilin-related protein [Shouchella clausii]